MFGLFKKSGTTDLRDSGIDVSKVQIYKEGPLTKMGDKVLNWKKRDFLLTPTTLEYFKPGDRKKSLGHIPLENAKVEKALKAEKKFCLQVITPKRTFFLAADSELEMNEWIRAIMDRLKMGKQTPEVKPEQQKPEELKETPPGPSPGTSTSNTPKDSFLETSNEKYKSGKSLEVTRINSVDIEKYEKEEKRDSKQQRNRKVLKMTIEEEFDVLLSAIHVFLKKPETRTPEEVAYVIAMKKYTEQLIEHVKKNGGRPEYSLSGGTYILCKDENERTLEEKEFVKQMFDEYNREVNDTKVFSISPELQLDVITQAKKAFENVYMYATYIGKVKETKRTIKTLETTHGLLPMYSMVSGSILLAKYDQEMSQGDKEFLREVEKL